jgi:CBS domain-containing protein
MKIQDIMTAPVETLSPESTLDEAARKMRDYNVGGLPLCDGGRLVGFITDRDIVIHATAEGLDPREVEVRDIGKRSVIYCHDTDELSDAARIMEVNQVRRLVVLDRDKKLVGIVSLGDLATRLGNEELSGEVLTYISQKAAQKAA